MTDVRIAYVINSLEGGGAALPIPAVVEVMRGTGAEVRVFALSRRDDRAAASLEAADIPFRICAARKSDHFRAAFWLRRQLSDFRPTLIWTSLTQATLIGQILGRGMGVPVVSWQHNVFLKPANRRLLRLTHRLTRIWVADSEATAALTQNDLGVDRRDIMIWPLFHSDPDAPVAQAHKEGAIFTFGSLGRLHPNKGYDILVRALAHIAATTPDIANRFCVVIGGEGEERERLGELAAKLGVNNIAFAGYQPGSRDFLSRLHAYLQPSRAEGLCIAAHEAMQAGLPVIVSDVGEMQNSVKHCEGGFIVRSGEVIALADAISFIVKNPANAFSVGQAARNNTLDRFSKVRFVNAGEAIMDRVRTEF